MTVGPEETEAEAEAEAEAVAEAVVDLGSGPVGGGGQDTCIVIALSSDALSTVRMQSGGNETLSLVAS